MDSVTFTAPKPSHRSVPLFARPRCPHDVPSLSRTQPPHILQSQGVLADGGAAKATRMARRTWSGLSHLSADPDYDPWSESDLSDSETGGIHFEDYFGTGL